MVVPVPWEPPSGPLLLKLLTSMCPALSYPWDMTAADFGTIATLFVTNVMNGTVAAGGAVVNGGTVARITLLTPTEDGDNDRDDSIPQLCCQKR